MRRILCAIIFCSASAAFGQSGDTVRVAVRADSVAYVYQSAVLPLGYGFELYRQDAPKGEFRKLTASPVRSAQSGGEFRSAIGPLFEELRSALNEDNPAAILFDLRNNRAAGLLWTYTHPEVAQALGRLFIDKHAPVGKRVTYLFKVVDPFGRETGKTFSTSVQLATERPVPPTTLTVSNAEDVVTLTWRYPKNGAGKDDAVIRFDVYRQPEGAVQAVRVNRQAVVRNEGAEQTTFTFRLPLDGVAQQFVVRAVDITGQSGTPSAPVRFTLRDTIPPAPPGGVEARVLPKDVVEVTWPVSVEADVAGYHVYRGASVEQGAKFQRLTTALLPLLHNMFRDTTITVERRNYVYRVTAVDRSGNESRKSNAAVAQVEDHNPPAKPASLQAEFQKDKSVKLTWPAVVLPPDFQTYIVTRRKLGIGETDVPTRLNIGSIRQTTFVDRGDAKEGFVPGASYLFTVASADSARNISDSVAVLVTIPRLTPPEPPTSVRASNDKGIRAVITWSASPSNDVAAYTLYRQERGKKEQMSVRVPAVHLLYRDETVRKPTTYLYWVTARDSIGRESKPSRADTVFVRDFEIPRMVRNVRAQVMEKGVRVTWEPAADSVVGYRVFRAPIATGVFELLTKDALTSTEYVDKTGNVNMWYRVRTTNASGNESHASEAAEAADARPASRRNGR